jgi:hypothetical protein
MVIARNGTNACHAVDESEVQRSHMLLNAS